MGILSKIRIEFVSWDAFEGRVLQVQNQIRKRTISDVKSSPSHIALRETRALFTSPKVWLGLAAATAFLGLSGPFGTIDSLPALSRFGYWGLVAVVTFFAGAYVSDWAMAWADRRKSSTPTKYFQIAIVTGLAVTLIVTAMNAILLGIDVLRAPLLLALVANTFAISLIVTAAVLAMLHRSEPAKAAARILARLDLEKRGPVISLSVQDHYVDVTTTKGSTLLLMRLSDAMNEVEDIDGLQVHRSHWVAKSHVTAARRVGDKGMLTMTNGRDIPISRTYIKAAKDAGLLATQGQ